MLNAKHHSGYCWVSCWIILSIMLDVTEYYAVYHWVLYWIFLSIMLDVTEYYAGYCWALCWILLRMMLYITEYHTGYYWVSCWMLLSIMLDIAEDDADGWWSVLEDLPGRGLPADWSVASVHSSILIFVKTIIMIPASWYCNNFVLAITRFLQSHSPLVVNISRIFWDTWGQIWIFFRLLAVFWGDEFPQVKEVCHGWLNSRQKLDKFS